jgi:thiol-disulfide isomerase/thioredoxin
MPHAASALIAAMTPGLFVLGGALVIAVVGGVAWRRANGKMRSPRARSSPWSSGRPEAGASVPLSPRVLQGAGLRAATDESAAMDESAAPLTSASAGPADAPDQGVVLTGDQLGHALGERATLVQFSSAFCAPCRATRRILADVAGMTEGVAHIEIDAESRLDLVRQLNVLRTPTVLVLSRDGRIVRRASGQPRKPDVIAAIGIVAEHNPYK